MATQQTDTSLPPEECSYSSSEVKIPMADGIHLVADLYQPRGLPEMTKSHGLLLVLSCYGRKERLATANATVFVARGYTVLLASSRGTFGSEGVFVPGMSEQADSQSIVRWMRKQSWYPGRFATFGASYLGYTQWALLRDPPEDLLGSIILAGPHDHARHIWDNGVFRMDRIFWNYLVARQEDLPAGGLAVVAGEPRAIYDTVPLSEGIEKLFAGRAPHMRQFTSISDIENAFWKPVRHAAALERVNKPIHLASGWYDCFTYQTIEQYQKLKERGALVTITIGPWTHIDACGPLQHPDVFDFLSEHVAGQPREQQPLPVKIFVTGAEEWRRLSAWPPSSDRMGTFYMHPDRSLTVSAPAEDLPEASFTFDPANPTPMLGGSLLFNGGRVDDSAYASRSDLLVYTSPSLTDDLEVMGKPVVQLAHSASSPFADLWVRLSEVDVEGVSHNIVESYKGLDPERQDDLVTFTLTDCAHVFKKGTQIRVIVAGGCFPLMARNPGIPGNRIMATELKSVTHNIKHASGVSKLDLPCQ